MIWRTLLGLLATMSLLGGLFFASMFYVFYWSHRDCFNDEGRCYVSDEMVVYHEQNIVLILPAAILLLGGMALMVAALWRRSSKRSLPSRGAN